MIKKTEDVLGSGIVSSFKDLYLSPKLQKSLSSLNFLYPSPIQKIIIPLAILGSDIIAQAKSGTGKTTAFSILLLEKLDSKILLPQSLIITPTREIAIQISNVLKKIGTYIDHLSISLFIGGINIKKDKQNLNCSICVGTPGRLSILIKSNLLNIKSIRHVILDEADILFTETFETDVTNILNTLPSRKQVMAFSATYLSSIEEEIKKYMKDPKIIMLSNDRPSLKGVSSYYYLLNNKSSKDLPSNISTFERKMEVILKIFESLMFHQAIVFSNDKSLGEYISTLLKMNGYPAAFIGANLKQFERNKIVSKFRKFKIRVLVSTDLTARGVDFERITLVINLDVPYDSETYLHRIGRTGRFGSHGIAITITDEEELVQLKKYQKILSSKLEEIPDNFESELNIIERTELSKKDNKQYNKYKDIRKRSMKNMGEVNVKSLLGMDHKNEDVKLKNEVIKSGIDQTLYQFEHIDLNDRESVYGRAEEYKNELRCSIDELEKRAMKLAGNLINE